MRLALLGDVHLFSLAVRKRRLLSKRVFAHTNLVLNRQHRFNHAVLEASVERIAAMSPDLLLLSGDVTTSSLEREFEDFKRYLAPLAEKVPAVLVPGNHDRYTFRSRRVRRIETLLDTMMPMQFPHLRRLEPAGSGLQRPASRWSLLALDAAIPNRVFSRGALGRAQLAVAVEMIRNVRSDEGLVVLCHYPCAVPRGTPRGWTHDLAEHRVLREALASCAGRVVYLHGHIHRPWYAPPEVLPSVPNGKALQPRLPFLCINAGSPCMVSPRYPAGQGFWELLLPDDPRDTVEAIHHRPQANESHTHAPAQMLQKTPPANVTHVSTVINEQSHPYTWVQTRYPASR